MPELSVVLAQETSVRQLIANGKFRTALENAKDFYKTHPSPASECLLLDAYAARIQALFDQNLTIEAKSLLNLVKERFPAALERFGALELSSSAHGGDLAELLRPLNDPALDSGRRAAIEQTIQNQVTDLAAIAACPALPPDHSLRQAAAALARAFEAVTSGTVSEEQIALPEVSRRSPLAGWKLLTRAIASLYRGEDELCREHLAAIKQESAAARLVPSMLAMLGEKPAAPLKPAEAALVSKVSVGVSELSRALADVERAFDKVAFRGNDGNVFKAVRESVRECRRSAPHLLEELRQLISVRGAVNGMDITRLTAALEGAPRRDAAFFRMYARALEGTDEGEDLEEACEVWDEFRREAVREGWFRETGPEAAVLYLHMAEVAGRLPDWIRHEALQSGRSDGSQGKDYFVFPEALYARACAIDPHPDAFSQWLKWAAGGPVYPAENVAREWHRIHPDSIEPLLYLMEQAEKRGAFPTALSWLQKAERVDAVHTRVRAARLRLLVAGTMNHLRKKKPHLAAEKLAELASMPQSRQGDRPAFLAALRHLICEAAGDRAGAAEARLEAEGLVGRLAAGVLLFGIGAVSKRLDLVEISALGALDRREKAAIPASLARVALLAGDLGVNKFAYPAAFLGEAEAQLKGACDSLDIEQLRALGELGMATGHPRLAWAVSGAGLARGGPNEARFLVLRARAMPPGDGQRYLAIGAAAAELGRLHHDTESIAKAVEMVRNPTGGDSVSLTLEHAREVVRRELASNAFPDRPGRGPTYNELIFPKKQCSCADCRRERREASQGDFDRDEMRKIFDEHAPADLPPEIAEMLFETLREGLLNGESPDEILDQVMGRGRHGAKKSKKGRQKQ